MILYLTDYPNPSRILLILLGEYFSDILDIFPISGKWNGHKIHLMNQSKVDDIILIIGINGRKIDHTPWQTHVFILSQGSTIQHLHCHHIVLLIDSFNQSRYFAITEQHLAPSIDCINNVRIWAWNSFWCRKIRVISCFNFIRSYLFIVIGLLRDGFRFHWNSFLCEFMVPLYPVKSRVIDLGKGSLPNELWRWILRGWSEFRAKSLDVPRSFPNLLILLKIKLCIF